MNYLLLAISIGACVLQNALLNRESKHGMKTQKSVYFFNMLLFAFGFLLFLLTAIGQPISLYTLGFGVFFGAVTIVQNICNLMALARGPMHITLLLTTSSLVIPSLSGIFIDGDKPSPLKITVIAVLIVFIYLSIDRRGNTDFKPHWFPCALTAFLCQAAVGIMQKIHQASAHHAETSGFLAAAFFCSFLFAAVMTLLASRNEKAAGIKGEAFPKGRMLIALICGLTTYLMNDLNLKLSGLIPSQIFFPLVNGASLLLNTLTAVLLFREKLTVRQRIGLAGGIAALILLCILP